jgi:hypothetical protein
MIRSVTNRRLATMLQGMTRFQRVALWPDSPRMHFLLRRSPVHWMRERLSMLARLEPQIHVVNRNVTNTQRISYHVASATRIVHRNSTILRQLSSTEPSTSAVVPASMSYERAETPQPRLSLSTVAPMSPARTSQQFPTRSETSPRAAMQPPLIARLSQRARRIDSAPVEVPVRLVRAPSAAPSAVAAQRFTRIDSSPTAGGVMRTNAAPAWPAPPGPGAAPVNVEQLTSEVIRQLDRRLVASRERMGRI